MEPEKLHTDIARNLAGVRVRIQDAARKAGRDPAGVRLLAVSKTFSLDHIRAAAEAGQQDFGENRVQEALQKIDGSADLRIRWHLIGPLQSNKVRKAVPRFGAIHSVDSVRLLEAIDTAAAHAGAGPEVLVQVDLAGEATKHGAPLTIVRDIVHAAERSRGESAAAFFGRVEVERVKALLLDLETLRPEDAVDADFVDLGEETAFKVETMAGECSV